MENDPPARILPQSVAATAFTSAPSWPRNGVAHATSPLVKVSAGGQPPVDDELDVIAEVALVVAPPIPVLDDASAPEPPLPKCLSSSPSKSVHPPPVIA